MGTDQVGKVVIGAVSRPSDKGGGGVGGRSSRPLEKAGARSPKEKIFRPYSKNKSGEGGGGRAPPLDSPLVTVNTLHHPSGNGFSIRTISARLPCLKNST